MRYWDKLHDIFPYIGPVSIRSKRANENICITQVPWKDLALTISKIIEKNPKISIDDLYFNESAPDHRLLVQGEYTNSQSIHGSYTGRYLKYNTQQISMRAAMSSGFSETSGILALVYLKSLMTPNSWEEFNDLNDAYPNSVIEFGIYDCYLGNHDQCNTIIWEVRDY